MNYFVFIVLCQITNGCSLFYYWKDMQKMSKIWVVCRVFLSMVNLMVHQNLQFKFWISWRKFVCWIVYVLLNTYSKIFIFILLFKLFDSITVSRIALCLYLVFMSCADLVFLNLLPSYFEKVENIFCILFSYKELFLLLNMFCIT